MSVFAGLYFPAFGLNTERHEVSPCIQSECEYYIIGLSGSLSISNPKKLKKPTRKKLFIFPEMELSSSKVKKNFLCFLKRKLLSYSPKRKLFLYFRIWNFLSQILKNSFSLLKESSSYISGSGTF